MKDLLVFIILLFFIWQAYRSFGPSKDRLISFIEKISIEVAREAHRQGVEGKPWESVELEIRQKIEELRNESE